MSSKTTATYGGNPSIVQVSPKAEAFMLKKGYAVIDKKDGISKLVLKDEVKK